MTKLNPWTFGAVLSITVLVSYVLCAVFWYAFPGAAVELLNGLFHGMDFRKIYVAAPFAIASFLYVLAVLAVWAYVLGAVYATIHNMLLGITVK